MPAPDQIAPTDTTDGLNRPWQVGSEYERLIHDANGDLIGMMNTPEQAEAVAEAVSAGDVDARREVARLTTLIAHYKARNRMTPSERQHYFDETPDEAAQPERWHIENVEKPAMALRDQARAALALLDSDPATRTHPASATLREALDTFHRDIPRWM